VPNNDCAEALFLLKSKPPYFLSGHLFHQIPPRLEALFHVSRAGTGASFLNKLTEKFSQRRKNFQIRSSSNLQSEIPGLNERGALIFLFPFQTFSRINPTTKK